MSGLSTDKEWVDSYCAGIEACVLRYRRMANEHRCEDLNDLLDQFNRGVPLLKQNRWLGYIQGVLIERKVTDVKTERDWTRPLFRPLDFQ